MIPLFVIGFFLAMPSALAETVTYRLVNGDVVTGKLDREASDDQFKVIVSPHIGQVKVPVSAIVKSTVLKPWKSDLRLGFSGSNTGDSRDYGLNLGLDSRYKDLQNTYAFKSSYEYATGDDGSNKGFAGLRFDRVFKESAWGFFAGSSYDYNADNDSGVGSSFTSFGLSYRLIKNKTTSLTVSSGPAVRWQGGGVDCASDRFCDRVDPAALVDLSFEWKPSKFVALSLTNQLRPVWYEDLRLANIVEASLKVFPAIDSPIYAGISARSIFDETKTPEWDNSFFVQLGTSL